MTNEDPVRQAGLPAGEVRVTERALESVAARAARQVPGAARLAALSVAPGRPGAPVEAEAQVVVTYGAPVERVAEQLRERIAAALARAVGREVEVRVLVRGLLRE